jgi:hypothetical protein
MEELLLTGGGRNLKLISMKSTPQLTLINGKNEESVRNLHKKASSKPPNPIPSGNWRGYDVKESTYILQILLL